MLNCGRYSFSSSEGITVWFRCRWHWLSVVLLCLATTFACVERSVIVAQPLIFSSRVSRAFKVHVLHVQSNRDEDFVKVTVP
jgi:hypothetical protein